MELGVVFIYIEHVVVWLCTWDSFIEHGVGFLFLIFVDLQF